MLISLNMDFFKIVFPVSGVETFLFLPILFSLVLSFFTSMGGVTGAVLILPFQVSVLGFTSASVSSTNLLYNIIGAPGGIIKYIRDGRMLWPLAWVISAGTLPGVFIGYYFRVKFLPNPTDFKLFAGIVILLLGLKLIQSTIKKKKGNEPVKHGKIKVLSFNLNNIKYDVMGNTESVSTLSVFFISLVVGIIGGTYGIGGGAIIAPICTAFFNLSIYAIAGPAIFGTFVTSIFGVLFYSLIPIAGKTAGPDWLLGFMFGIGGFLGMYLGAKCQTFFPEKIIKGILSFIFLFIASNYICQYITI